MILDEANDLGIKSAKSRSTNQQQQNSGNHTVASRESNKHATPGMSSRSFADKFISKVNPNRKPVVDLPESAHVQIDMQSNPDAEESENDQLSESSSERSRHDGYQGMPQN